jgi:hypothetical protein
MIEFMCVSSSDHGLQSLPDWRWPFRPPACQLAPLQRESGADSALIEVTQMMTRRTFVCACVTGASVRNVDILSPEIVLDSEDGVAANADFVVMKKIKKPLKIRRRMMSFNRSM